MNKTSFQLVADMNTAFGNPQGSYAGIEVGRLRKQCLNIADEFGELMIALGADEAMINQAVHTLKDAAANHITGFFTAWAARDALCDIQVFAMGAQHFMGVDGDADMRAVVAGVMTRFVKNPDDLAATIAKHAANGITKTYTEGEYPRKILKSAEDQPDAPKGKFLKSASFQDTVFPDVFVPRVGWFVDDRAWPVCTLPQRDTPLDTKCAGTNCGATDGVSHSPECIAEHDAAVNGAVESEGGLMD
jgi:hypothetical protein